MTQATRAERALDSLEHSVEKLVQDTAVPQWELWSEQLEMSSACSVHSNFTKGSLEANFSGYLGSHDMSDGSPRDLQFV